MKIDFSGIIQMFQMEGFIALGKLKHPATDNLEKNLDHASFIIDLISVLEEKSRGNLTDNEQRLIQHTLQDLRLNFVAESTNPLSPSTGEAT
ncbi:MAG: DUF1844 domain-containing protein [Ignavibacteriae bacterium]|nr:DUF1844 domain-containing protein [Ignavibacteriota bacterium]